MSLNQNLKKEIKRKKEDLEKLQFENLTLKNT